MSWCWWGHDWQAGEVVPLVFSKWAYWCPGYTFTSQHTSSPLGLHFHQPSPSPKWFAWKPPQQSALKKGLSAECQSVSAEIILHVDCTNELIFKKDINHYLILLGWGLHECSTPGISKFLSLLWLDNPGKNSMETVCYTQTWCTLLNRWWLCCWMRRQVVYATFLRIRLVIFLVLSTKIYDKSVHLLCLLFLLNCKGT